MELKIAILRGINVGGHRKILMNDLKVLCENLKLKEVRTYIQSGNILFKSNSKSEKLENEIEVAIKRKFGFDVPVIVRSLTEWKEIVHENPFCNDAYEVNNLHITFLKERPSKENVEIIKSYNYEPDLFIITEKSVFIFCEGKYHQSKLTNNFFEKKLLVNTTTRNWKTVLKLMELASNES